MKEENIKRLTERFFEGETTIEEEQTLYEYYNGEDISPELEEYVELFRDFAALPFTPKETDMPTIKKQMPAKRHYARLAIAASVAILLCFGAIRLLSTSSSDEECVAYIYGKKCTDPSLVEREMLRSMNEMNDMADENGMESQLRDLFTTE